MLQVYKRMFQGMFTMAFGEGATAGEINEATDPAAYISANGERIIAELNKLDTTNGGSKWGADQMLSRGEVVLSADKAALAKVLQSVGLDQYNLASGVPMDQVVAKLRGFSGESANVVAETHTAQQEHYARTSDFIMEASTGDISTGEKVSTARNTFMGVETGEVQMNLETVGKEVNLSSLADVLATHDVDQILAEINANGIGDKFTSVLMFGDSDIKAVSKAVKSKGYKDKGLFLNKEAGYIYMLLNDISDTQKEVKSLTGMQKMMRVLDGNKDGVLNAVTEAKYGEAQTLSVLEWMAEVQRTVSTEAQFDKLLRSIGFNPVSFKQNLDTNFFVTRLNFTEALKANQNMLPSLSSLAGGKTAEFTQAQLELQDKNLGEVEQLLLANASVKEVMDALDPSMRQRELTRMARDVVDFEGGGMLFTPHGVATAVSARIANDYHASIGTIEGDSIFVSLERNVINSGGTNVNLGVGTDFKKVCLYASASQVLRSGFDKKTVKNWSTDELFTGKTAISAHAVVTLSGLSGIGLNFDKSKSAAIANQVASVTADLTTLGTALIEANGKQVTFDSLGLTGDAADMQKNMKVFDMIVNRFNNDTTGLSPEAKQLYVKSMVAGYAQYVENNLYFQNEGVSLSGGGIGILAGHPVAFLGLEDINAKWNHNDVNNSATAATYEATRERGFTKGEIGAESGQVGPHKTLFFNGMVKGNISAKQGTGVEVQEKDGGLHISGNVKSIDLVRYVSPTNQKADILVINGGLVNGTEMVPGGYAIGITKSIPQNGTERYVTGQQAVTEQVTSPDTPYSRILGETIPNTHLEGLRKDMDAAINAGSVFESRGKTGLEDWQIAFAKAGRNIDATELTNLWSNVVSGDMSQFLEGKLGASNMNIIRSTTERSEKIHIMQGLMLAMRNDESTKGLTFADDVTTISKGRTVSEYYTPNMTDKMLTNISNVRDIPKAYLETAFNNLMNTPVQDADGNMVTVGTAKSLRTYSGLKNVNSSSSASQYFGDNPEKVKELRDTVVELNNGLHETIGASTPVDIQDAATKNKLIDNLTTELLNSKLATLNANTVGTYTVVDLQNAMKLGQPIEDVLVAYTPELTLTGNCANVQLDEGITLTQSGVSRGITTTVNRGYVNTYGERAISNIAYGKASMDGYQQAEFDVNKYILGIAVDTKKDKDGLATQGTDGDGLATQGTGGNGPGQGGSLTNGGGLPGSTPVVVDAGSLPQSSVAPKGHPITSADSTKYIHRNIDDKQD